MSSYHAIIFDLDGTLIETVDLYEEACIEAFALMKIKMTKSEFQHLYATGWRLPEWLTHYDIDIEHEPHLRKKRDDLYMQKLKTRAKWRSGAETVLKFARDKGPTAIVTGSWKRYIKALNERIHYDKYTKTMITADDMGEKQKPDPYGLMLAAEKLKVQPAQCIYIGDQPFDIEAAHAAGMASCLVHHDYTPLNTHEKAQHAVAELEDLLKIL